MNWRVACISSPNHRAVRVHENKWVVTMMVDFNGGTGGICTKSAFCYKGDGNWQSPAPNEMLDNHFDWEPEGYKDGLQRAIEMAIGVKTK